MSVTEMATLSIAPLPGLGRRPAGAAPAFWLPKRAGKRAEAYRLALTTGRMVGARAAAGESGAVADGNGRRRTLQLRFSGRLDKPWGRRRLGKDGADLPGAFAPPPLLAASMAASRPAGVARRSALGAALRVAATQVMLCGLFALALRLAG